jgi:hypothetical protein
MMKMHRSRPLPLLVPTPRRAVAVARPAPVHFLALQRGSEWHVYRRELAAPGYDSPWTSRVGFLIAGASIVAALKLAAAVTWSLL